MIIYLILSAILYAIPFLFSDFLWWLIFAFPFPLFIAVCKKQYSFFHGYVWGLIVFALHLLGGIKIVIQLSHEYWWIGLIMSVAVVLYQALYAGLFFLFAHIFAHSFFISSLCMRIFIWMIFLAGFIFWTDQYSMWIFGIQEGYPLMHPLILLVQQPALLRLLPIIGKQLLTFFFLLVSASFTLFFHCRNFKSFSLMIMTCFFWIGCWFIGLQSQKGLYWYDSIKSLPCMVHCTGNNPEIIMHIIAKHIKTILAEDEKVNVIIMPESALNIIDLGSRPELLAILSEKNVGRPLHIIFGVCRNDKELYYNSLYWIDNGISRACFDKKHAMLITERLSCWMECNKIRNIYFKNSFSITQSKNDRIILPLFEEITFVPYICSELFFAELPDDQSNDPIIVIINDTLLSGIYIQKLLLLLARFKALQWQRDIVYVSYGRSLFITKQARIKEINE
jgi:apolipoprotein N-acyltransferase